MHLEPQEQQLGPRVGGEVATLGRLVVGEEHQTALVGPAEQHRARRGATVGVGRGQHHRVGLGQLVGHAVEPLRELPDRIGVGVGDVEALGLVLDAAPGELLVVHDPVLSTTWPGFRLRTVPVMQAHADLTGLRTQIDDGVATVVIDHPPINLFDLDLMVSFDQLGTRLAEDDTVRVVVVESADPDFWIAHADVGLILTLPRDEGAVEPTELNFFHRMVDRFRAMPKATIAKIAGTARGGGAELASSFDMRIVADTAVLGQPEVALGILPGGSGTQRLAHLVGRSRALQIVLGCDDVDAHTAAAWGWVNQVVPAVDLDHTVDRLARQIASFPAAAIAEAKASVLAADPDPTPGLLQEGQRFSHLLGDPEAIRRMERFLELGGQTREVELDLPALYPDLDISVL